MKRRHLSRFSACARIAPFLAGALLAAACKSADAPSPKQAVAAAAPAKVEARPVDKLGGANQLFARGEYKAALESYDAILAKEPDNEAAVFNRAVALHRLGEIQGAKKAYESILAKNSEDVEAALNFGAILKDEGRIDEAIQVYNKVLKKNEFESRVLNNLTVLYRLKKQYAKAVDTVRKLLMRDQRNIDAYKNLALVYYDQKKYKLAQTILGNAQKMAEKAEKKDPDIFVNLGMIHIALGDNGKAMAAFKEAVAIDPTHLVANYDIGSLALAHRDYDLAAKTYAIVAKAWPEDYEVNVSLGYALQGQQKLPEAAKQLERARGLKVKEAVARNDAHAPDDEQIVWQLVQIYQNADDPETALRYADEYLRIKNKTCGETDTDEICGRYMGIKVTIDMKKQPPPEEEKKKKAAGNVEVFTDAPVEGAEEPSAESAPGGEGQEAKTGPEAGAQDPQAATGGAESAGTAAGAGGEGGTP